MRRALQLCIAAAAILLAVAVHGGQTNGVATGWLSWSAPTNAHWEVWSSSDLRNWKTDGLYPFTVTNAPYSIIGTDKFFRASTFIPTEGGGWQFYMGPIGTNVMYITSTNTP